MKGVDNNEKPRYKVKKEVRSGRKLRLCVTAFKKISIYVHDALDLPKWSYWYDGGDEANDVILNDSQDGHHLGTYYTFTE